MNRFVISNIGRFFLLLLVQYFLNLMHFTSLDLDPYFYIIFILLMPFETPAWLVLSISFIMGLGVDWFSDSMGQHAMASVFVAGIRPVVHNFLAGRNAYEQGTLPRLAYYGFSWAFKYAFIMTVAHQLVFYSIEAFGFQNIDLILVKVLINSILTTTLIILSQYWIFRKMT